MSSFCIFVKPTARRQETTFVSLLRLGPVWQGASLRLVRPEAVGLRYETVIGWSDFYGGSPAPVSVSRASDGDRVGWVVWGGSQGLRAVPSNGPASDGTVAPAAATPVSTEAAREAGDAGFDERPFLWLGEPSPLPREVVERVAGAEIEPFPGREDGRGGRSLRPGRTVLRS